MRREDRSSISSHPLADLGGQLVSILLCHPALLVLGGPVIVGLE
jgi:hypothetical protein